MRRRQLLEMLRRYRTGFMDEAAHVHRAMDFIAVNPECFERTFLPAHVTASCWVVNRERSHVLLMHHRKHGQWFQPGGHCEEDEDILAAALRETAEESGLSAGDFRLLAEDIFDVDIHRIPPTDELDRHDHVDIRFLIESDDRLRPPGNDESHDVRWVPLEQVTRYNNNRSTFRMIDKTRRIRPDSEQTAGHGNFHPSARGVRRCRY